MASESRWAYMGCSDEELRVHGWALSFQVLLGVQDLGSKAEGLDFMTATALLLANSGDRCSPYPPQNFFGVVMLVVAVLHVDLLGRYITRYITKQGQGLYEVEQQRVCMCPECAQQLQHSRPSGCWPSCCTLWPLEHKPPRDSARIPRKR